MPTAVTTTWRHQHRSSFAFRLALYEVLMARELGEACLPVWYVPLALIVVAPWTVWKILWAVVLAFSPLPQHLNPPRALVVHSACPLCPPKSTEAAAEVCQLYYSTHTRTHHFMLLRRIGLIGSFVFHGGAAKRSLAGFAFHQHGLRSVSTRHRAAVEMSSTSADGRTKIVAGIRELCDRYDGFILDQFGVLHGECYNLVYVTCTL